MPLCCSQRSLFLAHTAERAPLLLFSRSRALLSRSLALAAPAGSHGTFVRFSSPQ